MLAFPDCTFLSLVFSVTQAQQDHTIPPKTEVDAGREP